jgi:hypothetical protein
MNFKKLVKDGILKVERDPEDKEVVEVTVWEEEK